MLLIALSFKMYIAMSKLLNTVETVSDYNTTFTSL